MRRVIVVLIQITDDPNTKITSSEVGAGVLVMTTKCIIVL